MKLTEDNFLQIQRYFKNPDFFIEEILEIDTGLIDPDCSVTENKELTTEQVCAYIVWHATFHINQNIMFVTDKQYQKGKANKIVRDFLAKVPDYMKHKVVKANQTIIRLSTNTQILFNLARPYTGKGWTLGLVAFDRYEEYNQSVREEMMMGLFPCLVDRSQVIIVGEDYRFNW